MKTKINRLCTFCATVSRSLVNLPSTRRSLRADFIFQGKTIAVIQGRDPGGTGDLRVKALFPFLQKYIPGNPTIVSEYMPGGGSRKAANHIYSTAKPDGLSIGAVGAGLVAASILGLPGSQYDLDKLIYLGSTESADSYVFISRKEPAFDSLE